MKLFNYLILNLVTILIIINYTYLSIQVKAENQQNFQIEINQNNSDKPLNFILKSKEDAPGTTTAGGSYGDECLSTTIPLTALVYTEMNGKYLLNFTAEEHPTFWFYVDKNSNNKQNKFKSDLTGNFKLLNEKQELLYNKEYQLPEKLGLININLEKDSPSLEINKKYYWSFSIICNSEDNSKNPNVFAKIARIGITNNNIANLTPEEKIKFYAENGLWNETITTIMKELYPINHQQAISYLMQLLNSVGLNDVSEAIQNMMQFHYSATH